VRTVKLSKFMGTMLKMTLRQNMELVMLYKDVSVEDLVNFSLFFRPIKSFLNHPFLS